MHKRHRANSDPVRSSIANIQQQSQKKRQKVSALLEMPVEILLLIANQLPLHTRLVLARTCLQLRGIFCHRRLADMREANEPGLDLGQRLDFLACMARDRPDHWVCQRCEGLHPWQEGDHLADASSQVSHCKSRSGDRGGYDNAYPHHIYHLNVQLALKYSRFASEGKRAFGGQDRLNLLMSPLNGLQLKLRGGHETAVLYFVYPRVVNGRFLVQTELRYAGDIHLDPYNYFTNIITVCNHQDTRSWRTEKQLRWFGDGGIDSIFETLFKASKTPTGFEVHGACSYCCTDYSVQRLSGSIVLRSWQDFGPEASPTNPTWSALFSVLGDQTNIEHEPGSVRALYKSVDQEYKHLPVTAHGRFRECIM
ncbi:hypothetical protein CDD83_8043 [Cordyceps sp. RAO-2017]|nr:hypothetical protein CDD83_8043 [Cordyceps sp. RAO-2017]